LLVSHYVYMVREGIFLFFLDLQCQITLLLFLACEHTLFISSSFKKTSFEYGCVLSPMRDSCMHGTANLNQATSAHFVNSHDLNFISFQILSTSSHLIIYQYLHTYLTRAHSSGPLVSGSNCITCLSATSPIYLQINFHEPSLPQVKTSTKLRSVSWAWSEPFPELIPQVSSSRKG
jgi:hypothetical protein